MVIGAARDGGSAWLHSAVRRQCWRVPASCDDNVARVAGVHLQGHLARDIDEFRREYEAGDGTHHPGFGGSHLPDLTVVTPVHDAAGVHMFQREHKLDPNGFGDRATLKALGIAPSLDPKTSATLHGMIETLQASGRFTDAQIARIAESSQNYLLENRAALGEVTHIQLRNDGQKILFMNDFKQMRELDTLQALNGYVPPKPLVEAPVSASTPTAERTAGAVRQ